MVVEEEQYDICIPKPGNNFGQHHARTWSLERGGLCLDRYRENELGYAVRRMKELDNSDAQLFEDYASASTRNCSRYRPVSIGR